MVTTSLFLVQPKFLMLFEIDLDSIEGLEEMAWNFYVLMILFLPSHILINLHICLIAQN